LRHFALAALLELLEQIVQAGAQYTACGAACQQTA
jgi:hypothetical protein